ncbi:hypothetical protein R1sor_019026 [Riccia sorocarpa]|uniref:Uncharacterized protein n=1 Tax=Riccia sorocarpa TaxID=122646 RepID=A0ABD3ID36_9MARC
MYTLFGASDPSRHTYGLRLHKEEKYTARQPSVTYTVFGASDPRRHANGLRLYKEGKYTVRQASAMKEGIPIDIHPQCTPSSVPATPAGMPKGSRSQMMEGIPHNPIHPTDPADVAGNSTADPPEHRQTLETNFAAVYDDGFYQRPEIPNVPVANPNGSTAHAASVVTISTESDTAPFEPPDDSDVEIIESTPRRRPPTRSCPLFQQFQDQIDVPSQFDIPVVEVDVDVRQWHICRTSNRGSSPACFAAMPGRSAPRALC